MPHSRECAAAIAAGILPTTQLPEWQAEGVKNALQDPDPEIVAAAVNLLAKRQAIQSGLMQRLAALLSVQDPKVQRAAADALGSLGLAAAPYAKDIAELLKSNDPDVRNAAADALGKLGPAAAQYAKDIAGLLKPSSPPGVRMIVAGALGKLGPAAAPYAKDFAELLKSDDPDIRNIAVDAFGKLGPAAAPYAKDIAELLESHDPYVRRSAADALGKLGPVAAPYAKDIAELLKSDDRYVRRSAADALGKLGPAAAPVAKDIVELLKSDDPDVIRTAADALSKLGPAAAPVAKDIVELLKSDDPYVRRSAADALSKLGPAAAPFANDTAELLKSDNPGVRSSAANALGDLGPVAAPYVKDIAELLKSDDPDVRSSAADALGKLGPAAAPVAKDIVELLKSNDPEVRNIAAAALGKLGPAAAPVAKDIAGLLKSNDPLVRSSAATALGKLGPAAAPYAKDIAELLKSNDPDVRNTAAAALGELGPAAALVAKDIAELLKSDDLGVRLRAANALGDLGPAAAPYAKDIVELLKSNDPDVRNTATAALGKLGPAAAPAAEDIAELLKSDNLGVRLRAATALGNLGPAAAPYAKDIVELLKFNDPEVRSIAAAALGKLGPAAAPVAKDIAELLKSDNLGMRLSAADALGDLGPAAAPYAKDIAELLKSDLADVRRSAADALGKFEPELLTEYSDSLARLLYNPLAREASSTLLRQGVKVSPFSTLIILNSAHLDQNSRAERCLDAYLTASDPQQFLLIRWLGDRTEDQRASLKNLTDADRVALLKELNQACLQTKEESLRKIRQEIAELISALVKDSGRRWAGVPLLEQSVEALRNVGSDANAGVVQSELDAIEWWRKARVGIWTVAAHALFWFALIALYPRSRIVQVVFFWNKWVRWIAGCGYVHLLLIAVPWLRRRLFSPFRESLVQRGDVGEFNDAAYFADSDVRWGPRDHPQTASVAKIFNYVTGQSVIGGPSGLGKSTLLRHLAIASRKTVVLLRATDCVEGVEDAIRRKLKGIASDVNFLRSLVHVGALDVLIDGINEASPDTRARISRFIEDYFKGNFIVTTQPMSIADWEPPRTAQIYRLLPLRAEQVEAFLNMQWSVVEHIAQISREDFNREASQISMEHATAADAASPGTDQPIGLANPMDATLAAELIARRQTPELERLIDQHFELVRQTFARDNPGRQFALRKLSERIYEAVCAANSELNLEELEAERDSLVEHRLLLERQTRRLQAGGETFIRTWSFRHEKIRDYFLVHAFLDPGSDRPHMHVDREDVFGGVYELLATRLPETEALELQKFLLDDAADHHRNRLLNRYTLAIRKRKAELILPEFASEMSAKQP
jgi:HEAT repeat protein